MIIVRLLSPSLPGWFWHHQVYSAPESRHCYGINYTHHRLNERYRLVTPQTTRPCRAIRLTLLRDDRLETRSRKNPQCPLSDHVPCTRRYCKAIQTQHSHRTSE